MEEDTRCLGIRTNRICRFENKVGLYLKLLVGLDRCFLGCTQNCQLFFCSCGDPHGVVVSESEEKTGLIEKEELLSSALKEGRPVRQSVKGLYLSFPGRC